MTELADKLNYDREVIRVWFCNKRQALKNTIKKLKQEGPWLEQWCVRSIVIGQWHIVFSSGIRLMWKLQWLVASDAGKCQKSCDWIKKWISKQWTSCCVSCSIDSFRFSLLTCWLNLDRKMQCLVDVMREGSYKCGESWSKLICFIQIST